MEKRIRDDFLEDCDDDFSEFCHLVRNVRLQYPAWSDEKIKNETLEFLEELLTSERIIAVNPYQRQYFVPLQSDIRKILHNVRRAWDALGRDPSLGEIVWFTSSDYESPIDVPGPEWNDGFENLNDD